MLTGIGTALLGFGAFLGLSVALFPLPDADDVGVREYGRRHRNASVLTSAAAVSGFVGAVCLLTATWPWGVVAFATAALLVYVVLAAGTLWDGRMWLSIVTREREADRGLDGSLGRISLNTAAAFSVAPSVDGLGALAAHFYGAAGDEGAIRIAEGVHTIARERARWRWALAHPRGTPRRPLGRAIRDTRIVWDFRIDRARRVLGRRPPT